MGASITFLKNGKVLTSNNSRFANAGSNVSVGGNSDAVADATWTYNYHPIWNEIDFRPWDYLYTGALARRDFYELMGRLYMAIQKVKELPNQNLDRDGGLQHESSSYWAATPANALKCLEWLLFWLSLGPDEVYAGY